MPRASLDVTVGAVTHPRMDAESFRWLLGKYGSELPIEHIDGEAVVTPPPGGWHSVADVRLLAAMLGLAVELAATRDC